MKRLALFFLPAVVAGSLFANSGYYEEECCRSRCFNFEVDAEFLYFMPTFDDTYFVISQSITGAVSVVGERFNNDFKFHPGFRVGLALEFLDCCDGTFQVDYARVSANQTKTVTGRLLLATNQAPIITEFIPGGGYSGIATSRLNFLYQRIDAFYAHHFWCNSCVTFDGFFGLEYAYLRLNENYLFAPLIGASAVSNMQARTWGIGPQAGVHFDYLLWQTHCCPGALSFVASTSGSLLVSKKELHTFSRYNAAPFSTIDVTDEITWRLIPAFHTRVGFNYAACFSCWHASLEIGYEFTSYLRGLARHLFPDDVNSGTCTTSFYNFDIQGLYVALNVGF